MFNAGDFAPGSVESFYEPSIETICRDPEIADRLFPVRGGPEERIKNLRALIGEASQTVQMIARYVPGRKALLEIGGGVGLTYGYLSSKGYDIVSVEPGEAGFGGRHEVGVLLLRTLGISTDKWLPLSTNQLQQLKSTFHLIFSNFVLEHIQELETAFLEMSKVLAEDALMVHRCPNYRVPFEPHYNIPLVPFFPKLTASLIPRIKRDPLWLSLNFVSPTTVKILCRRSDLDVQFETGRYFWAFSRLLESQEFRERKPGLVFIAKVLRKIGGFPLLKRIPVFMTTPMEFTARRCLR